MTPQDTYWRDLIVETVRDPSAAARQLIGLRLRPDALWTALILAAALNALIFGFSEALSSSEQPAQMPAFFTQPLVFFGLIAASLVLFAYALTWVGKWLGGQGQLEDVLVLLVWLQALRVLVQAAAFVLIMIMPVLAVMLVMAASFLGLWITVNFIKTVHGFDSFVRAIFVMIGAALLMALGVSFLLSLLGPSLLEVPANA